MTIGAGIIQKFGSIEWFLNDTCIVTSGLKNVFTFKLLKYQGQTGWQMTQQMLIPVLSSPFQPRIFTAIGGLRVLE